MSPQSKVHLLVLVHGMWGHPGHLAEMARIIRETKQQEDADGVSLHVLLADSNRDDSTYDGVDWGGERVAEEVVEEVQKLAESGKVVTRFSVTGYSLGGLVSRYLIGVLHQRNFFKDIVPVNFNTVATPHIGLLRYPSVVSSIFSTLGPRLLSRTGEQFYCVDKWSATGRPLLEVMADPGRIFYQSLKRFKNIRIYANAINDMTVPYPTSAMDATDPFAQASTTGLQVHLNEKYSPLIDSYTLPPTPPELPPQPTMFSVAWFRSLGPSRPILPPLLQFRFPFNIVMYLLLPLLIPLFLLMIIVRFVLATRSSRARIKLLEEHPSREQRLLNILSLVEKEVENRIVDLMEEPSALEGGNGAPAMQAATHKSQPIISAVQRRILASLNQLPIKKELAYIPDVRNSHAIIVCRDVKRFEAHRIGEGVVRHWADSFDL
ncbi:hypothetical protein HGRIS_004933 [Hohenbuehelia grisea]|uniref:DUF676 domain-containing protein n=1 Tax=Hohenbuehelia grisea TaxID=104357 RepID=A0ABR3JEA0_9AGAR